MPLVCFFTDKLKRIVVKVCGTIASGALSPLVQLAHAVPTAFKSVRRHRRSVSHLDDLQNLAQMSSTEYIGTSTLNGYGFVFGLLIAGLVNTSFAVLSNFPDTFKVVQVTPFLKKSCSSGKNLAIYHPVANLNCCVDTSNHNLTSNLRQLHSSLDHYSHDQGSEIFCCLILIR